MASALELPNEVKRVNPKRFLKNRVSGDPSTRTFGAEVTNLPEGQIWKVVGLGLTLDTAPVHAGGDHSTDAAVTGREVMSNAPDEDVVGSSAAWPRISSDVAPLSRSSTWNCR